MPATFVARNIQKINKNVGYIVAHNIQKINKNAADCRGMSANL